MLSSLAADATVAALVTLVVGLALDFHLNGRPRPRR